MLFTRIKQNADVEENIETFDTSTVRTIRAVRPEHPSASITDYRRKHSRDRKLIFSVCVKLAEAHQVDCVCVIDTSSSMIFVVRLSFDIFIRFFLRRKKNITNLTKLSVF